MIKVPRFREILTMTLFGKKVTIVDLTQCLDNDIPTYPGHLRFHTWDYLTHEETKKILSTGFSYAIKGIVMSDHASTHVDSVSHISTEPTAMSIDKVPLEWLITPGIRLDLSEMNIAGYIQKHHLIETLREIGISLKHNCSVLYCTGRYKLWNKRHRYLYGYPGLDKEATQWLVDQGAINIGCDAPSIDNPDDKGYPAHTVCRERGILNTENLKNIDKIPKPEFTYIGLSLKIKQGTGSPIRAIAIA